MAVRTRLEYIIEHQADVCAREGSRLYSHLLRRVARDVEIGGVFAVLLAEREHRRFQPAPLLRLMAGVHRVVLEGRAPALAQFYASVGGWFDPACDLRVGAARMDTAIEDPWPAFVETVVAHQPELSAHLHLPDQTNDVGRSPALLAGYLRIAELCPAPMRVLEVGAAGGLNLHWDRHRHEAPLWSTGPPAAGLRFDHSWAESPPPRVVVPEVVERRGCDLYPIDPGTVAGRLDLRSYTWPDERDRLRRLDRAIALSRRHPVSIDAEHAVPWLEQQLDQPIPGVVTVVVHSMITPSLSPLDRDRLEAVITGAGAQGSEAAPLAWLRVEPTQGQTDVRLTMWPHQHERVIARLSQDGTDRVATV